MPRLCRSFTWHDLMFQGPGRPAAWPEQSQVVVETITKTSTTQKFSAVQQHHESDASQVSAVGPGLQRAYVNKETTFTVDTSRAGECRVLQMPVLVTNQFSRLLICLELYHHSLKNNYVFILGLQKL